MAPKTKPSILNVGINLGHPLITKLQLPNMPEPSAVQSMVDSTVLKMKELGYDNYKAVSLDPDTHIEQLTSLLKEQKWDALIIGGGFKMIPALNTHLEELINLSKDLSPSTRIMFTSLPQGVPDVVKRFESLSSS